MRNAQDNVKLLLYEINQLNGLEIHEIQAFGYLIGSFSVKLVGRIIVPDSVLNWLKRGRENCTHPKPHPTYVVTTNWGTVFYTTCFFN